MTNLDQYLEWLPATLFHPERGQLLGLITESPRSAAELVGATGLAPQIVAAHLDLLQSHDIVAVEGTGETATYRLNEERIRRHRTQLTRGYADFRAQGSGRAGRRLFVHRGDARASG